MTATLEKTDTEDLVHKQLEAVKNRAVELWGDRWLMELCYKYAEAQGLHKRARITMVRSWFTHLKRPSLENFNNLLACVDCSLSIECKVKLL